MGEVFLGAALIFFALCTLVLAAAIGRLTQMLKQTPEHQTIWTRKDLH
ncbi:hypothetical protein PsAD5_00144 [Pseudovibrio sp. Ad5]|nr:hypothetical protein PsAD5_00144 [Pseudovibrio sp. Ad5]